MLREFKDAAGKTWRVWDVYPSLRTKPPEALTPVTPFPKQELTEGWLCFECESEKRRLAPIPPEWEICAPDLLAELCSRAGFITGREPGEEKTT